MIMKFYNFSMGFFNFIVAYRVNYSLEKIEIEERDTFMRFIQKNDKTGNNLKNTLSPNEKEKREISELIENIYDL
jgi:hypothetical protein